MIHQLLVTVLAIGLLGATSTGLHAGEETPAIRAGDRIVFIGDSITAQGARGGGGWLALIGDGLRQVRPTSLPVLIGLGGSGSTVSHWQHVEKHSRTEPSTLDDKEIDVGKTLDGKVDIVVMMLGMNDVLSPTLANTAADFDAWIARYRDLIDAVRTRCHPRVIALATVTPCTEDPASPKNVALAEMNQRLATLAREQGFRLLPTGAATYELQALGQTFNPEFHVTGDFVHPGGAGHLAIAVGMLRGLGEAAAADHLLTTHAGLYRPATDRLPTLSYTLARVPGSPDDAEQRFAISYRWTAAAATAAVVTPSVPEGWRSEPTSLTGDHGRFLISGPLERAQNQIRLNASAGGESRTQVISIPAAWRIASGRGRAAGWVHNSTYRPTDDRQPVDERLIVGEGLQAPVAFPLGDPGAWALYVASSDYTGLNRNGSVDLAAVAFFTHGQQAYGARWIHSARARMIDLELGTQGFAGTWSLGVWLNGKPAYEGKLPGEPERQVKTAMTLNQGWNLLVFKSSFIQWQWQFSIEVKGQAGDDLADLRFATRPPVVGR